MTVSGLMGGGGRRPVPGRTTYVLGISGSMRGTRLNGLKQVLLTPSGTDTTLADQLSMSHTSEQVTFLPFGTTPGSPATFDPEGRRRDRAGAVVWSESGLWTPWLHRCPGEVRGYPSRSFGPTTSSMSANLAQIDEHLHAKAEGKSSEIV
jgi:hypothetical protein